jgi:hypothetical protein
MIWQVIEYDYGGTDTVQVRLSDGNQEISILANVELVGRHAILRGLHIQGAGANTMGNGALRRLIKWAKEFLDVDHLRIEGATRTSGAAPGRDPPPIDT